MGGFGGGAGGAGLAQLLGQLSDQVSTGFTTYKLAKQARKQTRHARKFIQWQMRNRYQNMVADLRDAGLNPVLAISRGISGGSNAAPMSGVPGAPSFGGSARAIRDALRQKSELGILKAEQERGEATAQAEKKHAVELKAANVELVREQAARARSEKRLADLHSAHQTAALPAAETVGDFYRSELGRRLRTISTAAGDVFDALGPVGAGIAGFLFGRGKKKTRTGAKLTDAERAALQVEQQRRNRRKRR